MLTISKNNQVDELRSYSRSLIVAFAMGWLLIGSISCGVKEELTKEIPEFAPEVEKVLQDKIDIVSQLVLEDPSIIGSIKESNEKNKQITMSEIKKQDERWVSTDGIDGLAKELVSNKVSHTLKEFQDAHEGYSEIFITDANGLIVALTNKTSDYYQADEDWWIKTYNGGQGILSHGDIEYDESAMVEAIAIYLPIADPDTKKSIGVLKVLVNTTAIKMAL